MTLLDLFDLALMAAVIVAAYRSTGVGDLFTSIVLYIGYGFLLALIWLRLSAPDLALAEAAIGSGVTGALLLSAAAEMREVRRGPVASRVRSVGHWVLGAGSALVVIGAVVTVAGRSGSVGAQVFDHLGESGVSHAVTAVLLNFRAYDTLFEVGVLFAAGIALLALRGSAPLAPPPEGITRTGVAVRTSGLLVPFFVLSGGYLLWLGSHGPGGAFQGAAVGGAAGIYLYLVRAPKGHSLRDATWRLLLCAGFGVFLLAGAAGLGAGAAFLEYPPRWAGLLILLIESAVAASIAATLVILFLASPEQPREQPGVAD